MILGPWTDQIVTAKEPLGIRIHDKDGFVERVEQDRIRRLGADAVDLQKFVPQMRQMFLSLESLRLAHRLETSLIFIKEKPHDIL